MTTTTTTMSAMMMMVMMMKSVVNTHSLPFTQSHSIPYHHFVISLSFLLLLINGLPFPLLSQWAKNLPAVYRETQTQTTKFPIQHSSSTLSPSIFFHSVIIAAAAGVLLESNNIIYLILSECTSRLLLLLLMLRLSKEYSVREREREQTKLAFSPSLLTELGREPAENLVGQKIETLNRFDSVGSKHCVERERDERETLHIKNTEYEFKSIHHHSLNSHCRGYRFAEEKRRRKM